MVSPNNQPRLNYCLCFHRIFHKIFSLWIIDLLLKCNKFADKIHNFCNIQKCLLLLEFQVNLPRCVHTQLCMCFLHMFYNCVAWGFSSKIKLKSKYRGMSFFCVFKFTIMFFYWKHKKKSSNFCFTTKPQIIHKQYLNPKVNLIIFA